MICEHVTSIELSKKIKKLGYKRNTLFSYGKMRNEWNLGSSGNIVGDEIVKAFLSTELLEFLPFLIKYQHQRFYLVIDKIGEEEFLVSYFNDCRKAIPQILISKNDKNLANALAWVFIKLVESNYFDDEKIKS